MSHPLVLALFPSAAAAAVGARALHSLGVDRERISIVARNHEEEGILAEQLGGRPGADIEDSRTAARLGELGGQVLAAIAIVMPGIGPIVAAGPLSAGLGEAAGHVAGSVASVLRSAGVRDEDASAVEDSVSAGALLLAVHATPENAGAVREALAASGAERLLSATWSE